MIDAKKHGDKPALPICFLSEMWERFAFMILMGLLVFILIKEYHLADMRAAEMAGAFAGVIYMMSILGGYLADHYIGYYRGVMLGAGILIISYVLLAITNSLFFLCVSLGGISVGTGLLKSNVSSYLGLFFQDDHVKRQRAFSIFYAGINIGSMLGNVVSGYCFESFGSMPCFFLSTFGIFIGVMVFYFGFKFWKIPIIKNQITPSDWCCAGLISMVGILVSSYVIYVPDMAAFFFSFVIIAAFYLVYYYSRSSIEQMKKSFAYVLFLIISIVFNAIYFQLFLSMNIFNDRLVDHMILGHDITTQLFLIINNVVVIILSLTMTDVLSRLRDANKYILGMFLACFFFSIIQYGLSVTPPGEQMQAYWVVIAYIVISFAEICIRPIGLSIASRLAPSGRNGIFMGLWLVTSGIGGYIGGVFSKIAAVPSAAKNSVELMRPIYESAFQTYSMAIVIAFVATLCITAFIKRLIEPI